MPFKDLFTGSGAVRAQKTVRGLQGDTFNRNLAAHNAGYTGARNETITGRDAAITTLRGAQDAAGNAIRAGGADAIHHINRGVGAAQGALGKAREAFGTAGKAYDPLSTIAKRIDPAVGIYADAVGLNGDEGLTRARTAFGNSLQNSFELDQGLEAINRARAARGAGTISGGNVDRDAQVYGQNYANSKTNAYMDRLLGLVDRTSGLQGTVAAGRAGAANNIGNTYATEAGYLNAGGATKAQVAADTANRIAGLSSATGSQIANTQLSASDRLSNLAIGRAQGEIGMRTNHADRLGGSLLAEQQAREAAYGRSLDLGMNALGAAVSVAGGGIPGLKTVSGAVRNLSGAIPVPKPRPPGHPV